MEMKIKLTLIASFLLFLGFIGNCCTCPTASRITLEEMPMFREKISEYLDE
jgi:hypothetical protein